MLQDQPWTTMEMNISPSPDFKGRVMCLQKVVGAQPSSHGRACARSSHACVCPDEWSWSNAAPLFQIFNQTCLFGWNSSSWRMEGPFPATFYSLKLGLAGPRHFLWCSTTICSRLRLHVKCALSFCECVPVQTCMIFSRLGSLASDFL